MAAWHWQMEGSYGHPQEQGVPEKCICGYHVPINIIGWEKNKKGKYKDYYTDKSFPKTYEECAKLTEQKTDDYEQLALKKTVKNMNWCDTEYFAYPTW